MTCATTRRIQNLPRRQRHGLQLDLYEYMSIALWDINHLRTNITLKSVILTDSLTDLNYEVLSDV